MKNNWLLTDPPTDRRTHPLIKMRGRERRRKKDEEDEGVSKR